MTALIIVLFIGTALLSIPIAHALVLASVGGLLILDKVPVHLAIEQMLAQTQSFPLIAIPFFMMTGALMVWRPEKPQSHSGASLSNCAMRSNHPGTRL